MACTRAQLEELLGEGSLAGREVIALPLERSGEKVFAVAISPDELLEVWQEARALLPRSGRWPTAAATWDSDLASIVRDVTSEGATMPDVRAGAAIVSSDSARDALETRTASELPWTLEEEAARQASYAARTLDAAPRPEAILASLPVHSTDRDIDRWMLDWQTQHGARYLGDTDPAPWFEPDGDDCFLLFLPTPNGEESLAYIHFWSEEAVPGATPEVLIAMLRSWRENHGADLVAHWGTMLQFVVTRPPTSMDDARSLAWEHYRVAPCTTLLPGQEVRDYARSLVSTDRWFLHERP